MHQVALRSPHGSVVSEADKSLQSSPIAHTQYADRAKNGEGIITIVQDEFGRPIFDDTNSFAQTT